MNAQYILLPDLERIEKCSISQRHGWGDFDDLKKYIK
jgi:hypothetical protein